MLFTKIKGGEKTNTFIKRTSFYTLLRQGNRILCYLKQGFYLQLILSCLAFVSNLAQAQQWQLRNESSKVKGYNSKITGRELSKSINTENGWVQIFNGKENFYVRDIEISSSNPSIIYAAGNGVYRSTNSGVSWDSAGENSFLLIGVDPLNSEVVLGISSTPVLNNMYRTTNGGKKWDLFTLS